MTFYPVAEPEIGKEEEANVVECIRSNWISSLGKFIGEFETSFSQKFHRQNALTVSNGTTALHLALIGLNISPGDEVLLPALTFVACVNAVLYVRR
jgi:perosamine synthetase